MEQRIIELLKAKQEKTAIQLYKNTFRSTLEEAKAAVEVIKADNNDVSPNHRSDSGFSQNEINAVLYHLAYGEENSVLNYYQDKYGINEKEAYSIIDNLYDRELPRLASYDTFNLNAVLDLLKQGRKIAAIQLYRKVYPVNFMSAKQTVEQLQYIFH